MRIFIVFFLLSFLTLAFTTPIVEKKALEAYQLTKADLPKGYKLTSSLNCKSIQAANFYTDVETLYSLFLGKIVAKGFQSFKNKKEQGTILYFQFENKFEGQSFLEGYLWGQSKKPNAKHPDEYIVIDDNVLIIWSTGLTSNLKEISKKKNQVNK